MKNITPTTAVVGDGTTKPVASILSPGDTPPVSRDILLALGTIYAGQGVTAMLADDCTEGAQARGVQAGIVIALHKIIPADQFKAVMVQWEVDAIKLTELLELTGENQS